MITVTAQEGIIAIAAIEGVIARSTVEMVVAATTKEAIGHLHSHRGSAGDGIHLALTP